MKNYVFTITERECVRALKERFPKEMRDKEKRQELLGQLKDSIESYCREWDTYCVNAVSL